MPRLSNGNTLVHFGTTRAIGSATAGGPMETFEVTSDGTVVWHLTIDPVTSAYRTNALTNIAGETVVERARPR